MKALALNHRIESATADRIKRSANPMSSTSEGPNYQDRIERNYEVAVRPDELATFWRELREFFLKYGLHPINEITCVGTVYFDNKDLDLTRYTVLNPGRRMLVRLRTYESYGESPKPISDYWMEVKIRLKGQWKKKRVRLNRTALADFLEGRDVAQSILDDSQNGSDPEVISRLYREIQELILTMGLKPFFLLTYKRLAFQNKVERISLDWDNQYYHVGTGVYSYDSWKYPVEQPDGKSRKIILELKYPPRAFPAWIADLERTYPIQETGFLKFVEGMGFLFRGSLKSHPEADYFLRLINAYGGEGGPLR
jgi:SPX domain protein involved in polyphosphate accumulation